MTHENVAASQPSEPTIATILIEAATTDQPEAATMRRIAEHHPEATRKEIEAEREAVRGILAWHQDGDKRTVPVDWVVDRFLNQALDAVEARRSAEPTAAQSVLEAAAGLIAQHSAQQAILVALAMDQLEYVLDEVAHERGVRLSDKAVNWPFVVEATEEEWNAATSEQ
jgi:hypothetical protein